MGNNTNHINSIYDRLFDYKYFNEITTTVVENDTTDSFIIKPSSKYMRSFYDFHYQHYISEFPKEWAKSNNFLLVYEKGTAIRCFSNESYYFLLKEILINDQFEVEFPVTYDKIVNEYENIIRNNKRL